MMAAANSLAEPSAELVALLAEDAAQPVDASLAPLIQAVHQRFAGSVQAILFYGSCMRQQHANQGIADIYVLVDSYQHCYSHRPMAWANAWLPPNVFMLNAIPDDQPNDQPDDEPGDDLAARQLAKCAVLTLADFDAGLRNWFHSYLWGRFAQPCRLVYHRDAQIALRIHQARGVAVMRLLAATLPLMPSQFTATELWQQGLALCYATELRPEQRGRAAQLASHDAELFQQLTDSVVLPGLIKQDTGFHYLSTRADAARARRAWWGRRRVGRSLNLLRLIKAAFTFSGGVDYILWKLERHTGTPIAASERLRRHPLIFGWPLLWRLWREGRLG